LEAGVTGYPLDYSVLEPTLTDQINAERDLLDMTADIVAAFVTNNKIGADEVSGLISSIHSALGSVGEPVADAAPEPVLKMTAAQARKLIPPAGIISMIDGRPFKSMKRHVSTHGYTPQSYREAFGLPADFPLVHPDYSASRSNLALAMGLGAGGRKPAKGAVKTGRKPKAG